MYNRKIVPHAMRHVIWKHEGQHAGQHPFYVDDRRLDGSFTFGSMLDRSSNFFVRKFRSHDSPLMEYIDAHSTDAERVTRVRNHFHWAVAKGLRDRASEPHVSDSEYAE